MSRLSNEEWKPTHDEIAACAQGIYEAEGRPQGKAMEHWLRAEAQLIAGRKHPSRATVMHVVPQAPSGPSGKSASTSNWQTASRQGLQKH